MILHYLLHFKRYFFILDNYGREWRGESKDLQVRWLIKEIAKK